MVTRTILFDWENGDLGRLRNDERRGKLNVHPVLSGALIFCKKRVRYGFFTYYSE